MNRKTDEAAIRAAVVDEVVAILRVALANDWNGGGIIASVLALKAKAAPETTSGTTTDPLGGFGTKDP